MAPQKVYKTTSGTLSPSFKNIRIPIDLTESDAEMKAEPH
jgi:hypothetical protein